MGPGLYIHVPFCVRKCAYCAFYSHPVDPHRVGEWRDGIAREWETLPIGFVPETVFIGGGTPTALAVTDLAWLLERVRQLGISAPLRHTSKSGALSEWTVEVNPGTLTAEKAAVLRTAGVNRLSVGAQSFADATLRGLGRIHTANETRECVELARAAGFDNIGLDVIYGVPGVTRESFCADIEAALALAPDHLSCYCLEIEPGTPFASEVAAGRMAVDEDEQREQFDWARQRLTAAGFNHYEISNFARPGCECRHNELYWTGGDYSGLGPGAHSHWQGRRWGNTTELPMWKRDFEEQLDPRKKACETLVMGLRRLAGWRREEFRAVTGFDYDEVRGPEIARLVADGLLVAESDGVRLAEDALFVSDSVFADLV